MCKLNPFQRIENAQVYTAAQMAKPFVCVLYQQEKSVSLADKEIRYKLVVILSKLI